MTATADISLCLSKGTATVEVSLRGRPGHGSVPKAADNALVRAADAVKRVSNYEAPTVITPGECHQSRMERHSLSGPFIGDQNMSYLNDCSGSFHICQRCVTCDIGKLQMGWALERKGYAAVEVRLFLPLSRRQNNFKISVLLFQFSPELSVPTWCMCTRVRQRCEIGCRLLKVDVHLMHTILHTLWEMK